MKRKLPDPINMSNTAFYISFFVIYRVQDHIRDPKGTTIETVLFIELKFPPKHPNTIFNMR